MLGWKEFELEVMRDPAGQLRHHLLDREPRSDGRAHRRLDHGRAGADADRQGIPDHARRLDRGHPRDRRRDRRLEHPVRGQPGRRPDGGHRDEPARVALLGAGLEGDRLPDRQDRGEARGRLHARRAQERHHRGETPASFEPTIDYVVTKIPRFAFEKFPRPTPPDHADEVRRRGDGDRPHLPGVAAEGAARARDRRRRPRRSKTPPTSARP